MSARVWPFKWFWPSCVPYTALSPTLQNHWQGDVRSWCSTSWGESSERPDKAGKLPQNEPTLELFSRGSALIFFSIPQSAGQETSARARFSPGSEERDTLRPRSPPRRKKWEVESSRQPEWANLLQQRGGKLLGLLKKPGEGTAATPQRVVRSATFCEYVTETDAEEQLTGRQSRSSARVCACRQRETLCLCHCAGRLGQRDQDGGLSRKRCIHTAPHMTRTFPAHSAFVCMFRNICFYTSSMYIF